MTDKAIAFFIAALYGAYEDCAGKLGSVKKLVSTQKD